MGRHIDRPRRPVRPRVALLTIDVKVFRYVLVAALTLVHVLAVNNGMQLHGRINLQHHVARFGVSVLIAGLAFWAAR